MSPQKLSELKLKLSRSKSPNREQAINRILYAQSQQDALAKLLKWTPNDAESIAAQREKAERLASEAALYATQQLAKG
jgi:hypothetical protein